MTSKRIEDWFLVDDLRWLGYAGIANDIADAENHEDVDEILAGMQWLIDAVNEDSL